MLDFKNIFYEISFYKLRLKVEQRAECVSVVKASACLILMSAFDMKY